MDPQEILQRFKLHSDSGTLKVISPIDGCELSRVQETSPQEVAQIIEKAEIAFKKWRLVPAPKRGELIRLFGEELRAHKEHLGALVTLESGKILQEGLGEVQEMIDICDFAVGLSRQLYGLTIASERLGHRMMETWHPLGPVLVISPFNFPVAVWCWNFALAIVCGNSVIWKPSEKTPLTALATLSLFEKALKKFNVSLDLLFLVIGGSDLGKALVENQKISLVSATGSASMGKAVAKAVASRLGKSLLELSGNNAMILTPSADQELAIRAIAFSALGTAGQRCTTLRRLIVHKSLYDQVLNRLSQIYQHVPVGNPLEAKILMGPLIDQRSFDEMQAALKEAPSQGGHVQGGERILEEKYPKAYYVRPALVAMKTQTEIVRKETFAPILYVIPYEDFDEALKMQNDVSQGLSSCIFTNDIREAETFLSARGSDCGIANVNIGPSGAEIGGAFGGEKETGGGRESGSDAWKNYMRRATNTINYSKELPLAQGILFDMGE
ncbi:aldehyde dehydrogenase family protein [Kamptonema cortianum]|jgi:aldehyde dehydrogenase (NAD+)|nr:aldehyde dehydrogenase family protein [Geitlerinema splendidum]MDK3161290.1 aldehyde dehydrogenase family protein [Kamptonema cortianum]